MNNEDEVTVVSFEVLPLYMPTDSPYWLVSARATFSDGHFGAWTFDAKSKIEAYDAAHRMFKVRCLARTAMHKARKNQQD